MCAVCCGLVMFGGAVLFLVADDMVLCLLLLLGSGCGLLCAVTIVRGCRCLVSRLLWCVAVVVG